MMLNMKELLVCSGIILYIILLFFSCFTWLAGTPHLPSPYLIYLLPLYHCYSLLSSLFSLHSFLISFPYLHFSIFPIIPLSSPYLTLPCLPLTSLSPVLASIFYISKGSNICLFFLRFSFLFIISRFSCLLELTFFNSVIRFFLLFFPYFYIV